MLLALPLLTYAQDEYLLEEFDEHKAKVNTVAFSKSGMYLASGGEDKLLCIRNREQSNADLLYPDNYFVVKDIEFFGDIQLFMSAGRDVKLLNLKNEQLALFKGNTTHVWSLDFAPERNKLTIGSYDKKIKVWDVNSQKIDFVLEGHEKNALAVAFSHDEKYLVSGARDLKIMVWNAKTGELMQTLERHTENIFDIEFHPNTQYFASASADKTIRLWDVETGKVVKTYAGHEKVVYDIEFSPDGYYMYSASADGVVYVWEVATGKKLHSFVKHEGAVNAIAVSNDGQYIATAGDDGMVFLWRSAKGIVADLNYFSEYNTEKSANTLFEKKRKGESKDEYASRLQEAEKAEQVIIDKYYKQYMASKNLKNVPTIKVE